MCLTAFLRRNDGQICDSGNLKCGERSPPRLGGSKRKTGDKPYFALQIRPRRLTAIWFVVWTIAPGKLEEIARLGADALSRGQ